MFSETLCKVVDGVFEEIAHRSDYFERGILAILADLESYFSLIRRVRLSVFLPKLFLAGLRGEIRFSLVPSPDKSVGRVSPNGDKPSKPAFLAAWLDFLTRFLRF